MRPTRVVDLQRVAQNRPAQVKVQEGLDLVYEIEGGILELVACEGDLKEEQDRALTERGRGGERGGCLGHVCRHQEPSSSSFPPAPKLQSQNWGAFPGAHPLGGVG